MAVVRIRNRNFFVAPTVTTYIYVTGFGKTRLIAGLRNSSYSPFSPAK